MTDENSNPVGRPLKFKTAEELQAAIDNYFRICDESIPKRPYTITGLALALETTRKLLWEYETRDEFRNVVLIAKARVENYVEEMMFHPKVKPAGMIFILKNMGWDDRTIHEMSGIGGRPMETHELTEEEYKAELERRGLPTEIFK